MTAIAYPPIEVHEDLAFQRKWWVVERVGWIVMLLIVGASAVGVFGAGPVSGTSQLSADGNVAIHYERILRRQAPQRTSLYLSQPAFSASLQISISREFIEKIELQHIHPQPHHSHSDPDRFVFSFDVPSNSAGLAIHVDFEARESGTLEAKWAIAKDTFSIRQFVLP